MKTGDFILIQAPMVQDLKLCGNALLIFALIHSFTKDGKRRFKGSYNYLAEWTGVNRRTVVETVQLLIDAGYINRYESKDLETNRSLNEYDTNYEELLDRIRGGEVFHGLDRKHRQKSIGGAGTTNQHHQSAPPIKESPLVVKTTSISGAGTTNISGAGTTTNSINSINNNYSSSLEAPFKEEEKEEFYINFYLKNASQPRAEVEKFVAYNTSLGWKDTKGNCYDTPEKRLALSNLWQFKNGTSRLGDAKTSADLLNISCFYKLMTALVAKAREVGDILPSELLTQSCRMDVRTIGADEIVLTWHNTKAACDWLDNYLRGRWGRQTVKESYRSLGDVKNIYFEYTNTL